MTSPATPANRRIDRVLAPGFVAGLSALSLEEVRDRRDDADQEEVDLSYMRRLLQGRLDIVRAEQAHRAGTLDNVVAALPQLLSEETRTGAAGLGRHRTVEPSRMGETRRREEALAADAEISDPASLRDDELVAAAQRLVAEEAEISARRRLVQVVLDTLSAEIGRRYRDGSASVDTLLAT